MSLVEEGTTRTVRMAHLAIVGSHSTNGVAAIHSQLVRTRLVPDFAEMYPERFRNITNGVTPRRWVALANPDLAGLLTEAIGDGWLTETGRLEQLRPLADDPVFRERFRRAKRGAKLRLVDWLRKSSGLAVDPDTIFDCHIKRIHEYKRQLLNALHIVVLYNRLRKDPGLDLPPRTFFFAGKAAPAYHLAKLVIFFIHRVAAAIEADTIISRKLRVLFLPNYNVSLAERLIPAADISEQLSTAGYEASGTSNMKFMMNGALTVATRDGATIEMYQRAGEENFFLFGLDAEQVATTRPWYLARWHYENDAEVRETLDLIRDNHFCPDQPGAFQPLVDQLLERNDYYLHLADLQSYAAAQHRAGQRFRDADDWSRLAVLNVAASGHFSSDRTIREYAEQVWRAEGCRIP
jgi:starch phosphorylase